MEKFLESIGMVQDKIDAFIAHPGGKKVLEEMEHACNIPYEKLTYSYEVLNHHGNMSSATVMYVLEKWLYDDTSKIKHQKNGLLSALGPGFSSELLSLKWVE